MSWTNSSAKSKSNDRRLPLSQTRPPVPGRLDQPEQEYVDDLHLDMRSHLHGSAVQRLFGCSDFFVRILPLHKLVCAGQLDLKTAQREIASNWIEAY